MGEKREQTTERNLILNGRERVDEIRKVQISHSRQERADRR
jgi:hypothetical protein